jgi:hypothetical protein
MNIELDPKPQLNKHAVSSSNFIFDFFDRQIIIDFYKNYPNGSYWKKPLVVSRFEQLKARKELQKELNKFFIPILDFLERKLRRMAK